MKRILQLFSIFILLSTVEIFGQALEINRDLNLKTNDIINVNELRVTSIKLNHLDLDSLITANTGPGITSIFDLPDVDSVGLQDFYILQWRDEFGTFVPTALPTPDAVTWGSISGTLSSQTDLNSALNGKENAFTKNTGFNKNFGTTAGTVSEGNHAHTFASITSKPTTLSGYGITDAVLSSRTITINGITQDLSANRTWVITGDGSGSVSDSSAIFNIEGWYYQDLPASQTEQILSKGNGSITHRYYPTRNVSLTKLSIASNSSTQVTGTATAVVFKNGTATGITVQLNSTYDFYNLAEFGIEELTLSSGSYIDIRITTSSDWNQTPDILVTAEFSTNEIDTNTISFDSITNYIETEVSKFTQYSLVIQNPDSLDSFTSFRTKQNIIIDSVFTLVQGSFDPSVEWNIYFGTNRSSGVSFYTVGNITSTDTTTGSTLIPFGENYNSEIPQNNLVWIEIAGILEDPTEFLCVIYYHY